MFAKLNLKDFIFLSLIYLSPASFIAGQYAAAIDNSPIREAAVKNAADKDALNDELNKQRKNIITETVKKVSPAVVGINVTQIQQYRDPFASFFDDPFFRQFYNDRTYSQKVKSLGSGYIISEDGYIVTNDHVAGNASEIYVSMTNGKHYKAEIVGTDNVSDICLLKIKADDLPFLPLGNSDDIIIGEWVIAFGNPFGLFDVGNKPTVTLGVVSATGMNLDPIQNRYYLNMIQTDAAINGGNSGGPLVNCLGEIIGMNTIIYTAGGVQGNIGLGFAIPINKIKKIVNELKDKGKIERDFYPGFTVQSIDEGIANYYKLESAKGVIVNRVERGTQAAKAGLEVGDIIFQVEDYVINNDIGLVGVLQEFRTGQTIKIKVLRNKDTLVLNYTLEKK
jgi:serine protease Do